MATKLLLLAVAVFASGVFGQPSDEVLGMSEKDVDAAFLKELAEDNSKSDAADAKALADEERSDAELIEKDAAEEASVHEATSDDESNQDTDDTQGEAEETKVLPRAAASLLAGWRF